jgi:hypothetical protein
VSRDELIRETVRALHGCLEPEKELDMTNTSIGVVGVGERFHILEGAEVAPFIAGLGVAGPGSGAMNVEEEAKEEAKEEGAAPPPASNAGAGGMVEEA